MEALFCSKCNEKIVEEYLPCKYCGTLNNRAAEGAASNQETPAKPSKSKLIFLIICLLVVIAAAFIFLR